MSALTLGTVVALLTSSACHTAGRQTAATPPAIPNPVEHGFSPEGLERIQALMDSAVRVGRIPSGIAMLARDDSIVWLGTAGDMGPGVPMRNDAIFPLASVGKMYTAVAAMILVERGVIALDDPVSKYIPEFGSVRVEAADDSGRASLVPPERPVTVYHLLTHTGGLRVTGDAFWAAWNAHAARTTTTHFARALAALPLQSHPGLAFAYGSTGASYEVLGAVIEIAGGKTLEAFMTETIFAPLGLNDTHFYLPEGKSGRIPAFFRRVSGALQPDRPYGVDFPRTSFFHGGGGVQSAPRDILRFAQIFLDGGAVGGIRILRPETVRLMMSDHLGDKSRLRGGRSWGFGAGVRFEEEQGVRTLGQYGWAGGGYARFWVDPRDRLVAFFAVSLMPPGDSALLDEFERLVYAAVTKPASGP